MQPKLYLCKRFNVEGGFFVFLFVRFGLLNFMPSQKLLLTLECALSPRLTIIKPSCRSGKSILETWWGTGMIVVTRVKSQEAWSQYLGLL